MGKGSDHAEDSAALAGTPARASGLLMHAAWSSFFFIVGEESRLGKAMNIAIEDWGDVSQLGVRFGGLTCCVRTRNIARDGEDEIRVALAPFPRGYVQTGERFRPLTIPLPLAGA